MGMKSPGGEIVQVQGGHIVRSTGRKDRHSKVFTAKGARDRRVRLSAHTAIQFYDVQDRLGYDRPSKAVDWLIKKAKSAIDKLAELPPWNPGEDVNASMDVNRGVESADMGVGDQLESSGYNFQLHRQLSNNLNTDSDFLSQSMVPDSIPDNMKPFFPTNSNGGGASMNFHSYHDPDGNPSPDEDLGLSLHSLHSLQNQGLIHRQPQADGNHHTGGTGHALFPGSGHEELDSSFQRVVAWSNETNSEDRPPAASVFGGFGFNQPPLTQQQLLLSQHGSGFSQRGPLQSSFLPSIRAWVDLSMASVDHNRQQDVQESLVVGSRFSSEGLSAFSVPVQIHGEEEQSVLSDTQPSLSPTSQH